MKYDFKTLCDMYHKKQLTPELRKSIQKDLREKKEHVNQRHFKLKDGTCIDLIALQQEVLDKDCLFLAKLPLIDRNREQPCHKND